MTNWRRSLPPHFQSRMLKKIGMQARTKVLLTSKKLMMSSSKVLVFWMSRKKASLLGKTQRKFMKLRFPRSSNNWSSSWRTSSQKLWQPATCSRSSLTSTKWLPDPRFVAQSSNTRASSWIKCTKTLTNLNLSCSTRIRWTKLLTKPVICLIS